MATVEEVKVTGRKFRIWDSVNDIWKRISYWTKASDVEFENGQNAEDCIEDIRSLIGDNYEAVTLDINDVANSRIPKEQLTFVLSGNDLYITKLY